jgi:hypothetical protein
VALAHTGERGSLTTAAHRADDCVVMIRSSISLPF